MSYDLLKRTVADLCGRGNPSENGRSAVPPRPGPRPRSQIWSHSRAFSGVQYGQVPPTCRSRTAADMAGHTAADLESVLAAINAVLR